MTLFTLSGLEFMTEMIDLLVQVSRGSSVHRGLSHERKSLCGGESEGQEANAGLKRPQGFPAPSDNILIYIYAFSLLSRTPLSGGLQSI